MEHAKKIMLIEPRFLEELQSHREYKELLKPTTMKAKVAASMNLQQILQEDEVPDDIKVKVYQQELNKLLNLKDKVPQQVKGKINWLTQLPPPLPPLPPSPPVTRQAAAQQPAAARATVSVKRVSPPTRASTKKRPRKSPPTTSVQQLLPLPSDIEWEDY